MSSEWSSSQRGRWSYSDAQSILPHAFHWYLHFHPSNWWWVSCWPMPKFQHFLSSHLSSLAVGDDSFARNLTDRIKRGIHEFIVLCRTCLEGDMEALTSIVQSRVVRESVLPQQSPDPLYSPVFFFQFPPPPFQLSRGAGLVRSILWFSSGWLLILLNNWTRFCPTSPSLIKRWSYSHFLLLAGMHKCLIRHSFIWQIHVWSQRFGIYVAYEYT